TRILFFDQFQLPRAIPFFHLTLAPKGGFTGLVSLKPDKRLDSVGGREAFDQPFAMLPDPLHQIIGYADIERAVPLARKDVNVESHAPRLWTPAFAGVSGV